MKTRASPGPLSVTGVVAGVAELSRVLVLKGSALAGTPLLMMKVRGVHGTGVLLCCVRT